MCLNVLFAFLVLSRLVSCLSVFILSCLLSCRVVSCLVLSYLFLSYLSVLVVFGVYVCVCLLLSCLSCLVSCLVSVLSCLVLSCLILSCLVLSFRGCCGCCICLCLSVFALSCLVLSCLVLSCLDLSCLVYCCVLRGWRSDLRTLHLFVWYERNARERDKRCVVRLKSCIGEKDYSTYINTKAQGQSKEIYTDLLRSCTPLLYLFALGTRTSKGLVERDSLEL